MADFAPLFTKLRLYRELGKSVGRDEIDAAEVTQLQGLVVAVAEEVGPVLARIATTFHQYTGHDIHHSRNVADRMGRLIPPQTLKHLNALELTFLLLSALLHDVGMAVTDAEKEETLASPAYKRFCEESHADRLKAIEKAQATQEPWRARLIEDALVAEFFRRLHAARVHGFLNKSFPGKLLFRGVSFAEDLGNLCESHSWGVDEGLDPSQPEKSVARLPTESLYGSVRVNLQYLACCLRLADIMDFDRSRTPLSVFQHLTITEPRSWDEWNKHLQVKGWVLEPDRVVFEIRCSHPVFLVAVQEFLGWIDQELGACRALTERQPEWIARKYQLRLPQLVDRSQVGMADPSYVAGAFRFQLEYEEILRLLMDKSLYPDPSLFLRELVQNSLDACRRKEAEAKLLGKRYKASIVCRDLSTDPSDPRIEFEDNGVGMSLRIIEQYFLRVGKSYYRSQEFDAERRRLADAGIDLDACSQFGIGILSCFLVCDRFEVLTRVEGGVLLHLEVEGPSKYFSIRRTGAGTAGYVSGPDRLLHGTCVVVHLWPDTKIDCAQVLDTFAVNVDYPIAIEGAGGKPVATIAAKRWEGRDICSDFPQICLRSPRGLQQERPVSTAPLFAASRIPFDSWDFSRHLKGRAWFWLLKGLDGRPTPACGYLRLTEHGLYLLGPPAFLAKVFHHVSEDPVVATREIERVAETLERMLNTDDAPDLLAQMDGEADHEVSMWSLWMSSSAAEDLLATWGDLSRAERQATTENLRAWCRKAGSLWLSSGRVLRQLLDGSLEWAKDGIRFSDPGGLPRVAHSLALSSIRLPAGVVYWDPQEGQAERMDLLPWHGGVQLDLRGSKAPQPSASRLWIDRREAEKFLCAFYRGLVRHAVDLAVKDEPARPWRNWLSEILRGIPSDISRQVWSYEASPLADRAGYLCLRPDSSLASLAKKAVPEAWRVWRQEEPAPKPLPGVLIDDDLNKRLLGLERWEMPAVGSPIDWSQAPGGSRRRVPPA